MNLMTCCIGSFLLKYTIRKIDHSEHELGRIIKKVALKYFNKRLRLGGIVEFNVNTNGICWIKKGILKD